MHLLIESLEGGIYLAHQVSGDKQSLLVDENSQPLRFHSLNQIRDYCEDRQFSQAKLLHRSAYDEMCGSDPERNSAMLLNLNWY